MGEQASSSTPPRMELSVSEGNSPRDTRPISPKDRNPFLPDIVNTELDSHQGSPRDPFPVNVTPSIPDLLTGSKPPSPRPIAELIRVQSAGSDDISQASTSASTSAASSSRSSDPFLQSANVASAGAKAFFGDLLQGVSKVVKKGK